MVILSLNFSKSTSVPELKLNWQFTQIFLVEFDRPGERSAE